MFVNEDVGLVGCFIFKLALSPKGYNNNERSNHHSRGQDT
jgi:hypothetical protein